MLEYKIEERRMQKFVYIFRSLENKVPCLFPFLLFSESLNITGGDGLENFLCCMTIESQ